MDSQIRLTLAAHLVKHLAAAQLRGRVMSLEDLAEKMPDHARTTVRTTLTRLHEEGLLDVSTMRLTMQGFALGRGLVKRKLAAIPAVIDYEPRYFAQTA
jgi:Mn-dependent DtxR family transcriptional regulator